MRRPYWPVLRSYQSTLSLDLPERSSTGAHATSTLKVAHACPLPPRARTRLHAQLSLIASAFAADKVIYAIAANISIASLNLSLMINSVGFYQIAKLLIIPFTAAVEALWLRDPLTMPQTVCTAVVLAGVAIVYASSRFHSMRTQPQLRYAPPDRLLKHAQSHAAAMLHALHPRDCDGRQSGGITHSFGSVRCYH